MSLEFLNGIGASRAKKQAQKAQIKKILAKTPQAKLIKAAVKVAKKSPQAKLIKAVAKQSPVAAQKIKKAVVQMKQRQAFKRAGEPVTVKPEFLEAQAEPTELPISIEEGTEEVNEAEYDDNNTGGENDQFDDMGIIYPGFNGAKKKAKKETKTANKAAKKSAKAPQKAAKKATRQAVVKKLGAGALAVAKATLEAKGIKFPSKEQIEKEAEEKPVKTEAKMNLMPLLIGGGVLAALLIFKK